MTSHTAGDLYLRSTLTVTLTFIMAKKKKKYKRTALPLPPPDAGQPQEEGRDSVNVCPPSVAPRGQETLQDLKT